MPHAKTKKVKAPRDYPGRMTREEYYALPSARRWLYAMRAKSDLLELWQTCTNKQCRRARSCQGDERCYTRPMQADLNNPNLGRPDFMFSYHYPEEFDEPFAILRTSAAQPVAQAAEAEELSCIRHALIP